MRPLDYLLLPWHALQLATGAKAFCDNPLIGSRRLNQRGLHAARVKLAARLATSRRRRLEKLLSSAEVAEFQANGFILKRDFLTPEEFAQLRKQVLAHRAEAREMVQGDTITRRIAVDPKALAAMPALKALVESPAFQGPIRYVGTYDAAPLVYIQSILPHRHAADPDPQTNLHADTFHATVKAWLFLTDVAPEDGPFTYVPGSHRDDAARLEWEKQRSLDAKHRERLSARGSLRIEPEELPALGLPPAKSFAVPANTLVVADTHGFHARGQATGASTRIEIWAYHRRNPFLPFTGLDWTGAKGLAHRRIGLFWAFNDVFERLTGQPWKKAGVKRPGDT